MIFLSFLSLIPRILLGFWITHFIWNTVEKKHLLIKVFLAGPIGFGVSSLLAFLWIWSGLPLLTYAILESIFILVFTPWMLWRSRDSILKIIRSYFLFDRSSALWLTLLFAGSLIFVIELVLTARQYPHGRMDAWTQWNVVARFIYLGGAHWRGTFLRQLDHPDYPLFLAMTNAITWTISNKDSIWGPITFHVSISFFTASLLFSLLNAFKGFKQAALAVILLLAQPIAAEIGMNQYADTLESNFFLAAGSLTVLYLSTREKSLALLVGLLTGLASWAKNEGQILVISCTIVWIIIALLGDRLGCRNYLLGLGLPLLVVILFKMYLAPVSDLLSSGQDVFERIQDMERYRIILNKAGTTIWNMGQRPISLIGLLLIYSLIVGRAETRIPGKWAIGIIILLQLAAYFILYLVTPYPLAWHLKTSIDRVLYHIVPLALFWMFIFIASPDELLPAREN
jgi:hypothetical protein